MIVNAEISTVKFDTFWKKGSISTKLLCPFKELVMENVYFLTVQKLKFFFWPTLTFVRSYRKEMQDHGQVALLQKIEENRSVRPCTATAELLQNNIPV